MRAVLKLPGMAPEIIDVDNELSALQEVVGGHLEHIGFGEGIGMLVDEWGRFKGPAVNGRPTSLPANFIFSPFGILVGPVLFIGEKGEDFADLEDRQVEIIKGFFGKEGLPE